MTTTPGRIEHIEPSLTALLNQTQPLAIVLNVPLRYNDRRGHWKAKVLSELPPFLKNERIFVHRTDDDYGPATKLVGTAIALSSATTRERLLKKFGRTQRDLDHAVVVASDDVDDRMLHHHRPP